jgi:hypothetical protein
VLRQKEKYLFPEDRSSSPVKRAKGKFPDIDRALSNWVRNSQKQGLPLTDAAIKEKAQFFAATVGNSESHLKANSTSWLEKFKQKNGIGSGKLMRRASETNISDSGSYGPDSAGPSASQTPSGHSPGSPGDITSPISGSKSDESMKSEVEDYLSNFGSTYRQSNSQSTTSLSSTFTDTAPSSFSGGATSPETPFAFSPDTSSAPFMPSQYSRLPPPAQGNNFQRPRSQTFPMLNIDPAFISPGQDSLTPKYNPSVTAPSSALDSPGQEMGSQFNIDSAISSPILHHRSSNGSMPALSSTPSNNSGLTSPPTGSSPTSPTQDDARRALDTLLNFFSNAPQGLVDQNEYLTVLKLTEKMRLHSSTPSQIPGGLHRIPEQDSDGQAQKLDHSMSVGA